MASAPKAPQAYASSSKAPKNPSTSAAAAPNYMGRPDHPDPNPSSALAPSTSAPPISMSQEDRYLGRSSHLTLPELLRRRSHHLKQLSKCYRDHYWALMEDLKALHKEYYWRYGVSPFKKENEARQGTGLGLERENGQNGEVKREGSGENANNYCGNVNKGSLDLKSTHCSYLGCKLKAMALTNFCHLHILRDPNQKLYKECNYVIKNAQGGPIYCSKPILRSTVPSLCSSHFQRAQKHVTRALKKAGLNVSSSSKLAPKFHVIVAEYVRQIQAKRRAALKSGESKSMIKQEDAELPHQQMQT